MPNQRQAHTLTKEVVSWNNWLAYLNRWSKGKYGVELTTIYPQHLLMDHYEEGWSTHKVKLGIPKVILPDWEQRLTRGELTFLCSIPSFDRGEYNRQKAYHKFAAFRRFTPLQEKQQRVTDALYPIASSKRLRKRFDKLNDIQKGILERHIFADEPMSLRDTADEMVYPIQRIEFEYKQAIRSLLKGKVAMTEMSKFF